ncbi:Uncharacterised protein [Vibrio cholerae]|uniref:Uncharacterized protein n=1 Tax=Vibrio cholerae TaxID=666 RepID=A0A655ZSN5_VIBCL|nr:Uncharacterised protein [Vibrio cholerae]CSC79040.1 Uncharacterised protein [Vibrio cholerae]CSI47171.1 Uncharacterised protein [Vibrio cholerae]CSI61147.1 Uncharacterised protein [Vibrio cholerae]
MWIEAVFDQARDLKLSNRCNGLRMQHRCSEVRKLHRLLIAKGFQKTRIIDQTRIAVINSIHIRPDFTTIRT